MCGVPTRALARWLKTPPVAAALAEMRAGMAERNDLLIASQQALAVNASLHTLHDAVLDHDALRASSLAATPSNRAADSPSQPPASATINSVDPSDDPTSDNPLSDAQPDPTTGAPRFETAADRSTASTTRAIDRAGDRARAAEQKAFEVRRRLRDSTSRAVSLFLRMGPAGTTSARRPTQPQLARARRSHATEAAAGRPHVLDAVPQG